jgi:hypothetical protein
MDGDLKIAFAQRAMAEYMKDVIEAMRREIIKRKVRHSDELLNSLAYNVYQQDAAAAGTLSFAEWGRFVDMGVGKGHPLGGIQATKDILTAKKGNLRKPKKIYSPIAYGKLNGLIGDLMYGFTETTKALIKQELDAQAVTGQATA